MIVRLASVSDLPWLTTQLRAMAATFPAHRSLFPANPDVADALLRGFIAQQPFFIATDRDGTPVGLMLGALTPHPFNPDIRVLSELLWWVMPEHRGSAAASALLRRFLAFGHGYADWIVMAVQPDSNVAERHLTRRGFVPYDRPYLLEVA